MILDVVYNHTAESDDKHTYPLSFRPIDNKAYFLVGNNGDLMNFSGTLCNSSLIGDYTCEPKAISSALTGCGNTFNCNGSLGKQLILDSLRHWVSEYHIDGFRCVLLFLSIPLPSPLGWSAEMNSPRLSIV